MSRSLGRALHLGYNRSRYVYPEHVWQFWDKKLTGGPFKHIVPRPSETLRVAALPAQALGYVPRPFGESEIKSEHCNPLCGNVQEVDS